MNTGASRSTGALAWLALAATSACRAPPSVVPPDVLIVTLDTFRADHMPGFGGDASRWPELAAWSQAGLRFTRAYTVAPVTIPAHTSLFTGNLPRRHGVRRQAPDLRPLGYDLLTALRGRGYERAGFVGASVLNPGYTPLYTSFEHFGTSTAPQRDGAEVVAEAAAWLASAPADKPILLWVHLFDTHLPYAPRAPKFARCPEPARRAALEAMRSQPSGKAQTFEAPWWPDCLRELYAAEVDQVDVLMGEVRKLMAARARWTWAVLADHGECLDEEGVRARHGGTLLECAVRIPLIIGGEGVTPGADDRLASIIDVAPTLARLTGVGLTGVDGVDLLGPRAVGRMVPFEAVGLPVPRLQLPRVGAWSTSHKVTARDRPWVLDAYVERAGDALPTDLQSVEPALRAFVMELTKDPPPDGLDHDPVEPGLAEQLRALGYSR